MALHLTSCVAHGLVETEFGKQKPDLARWLDQVNREVEAFNDADGWTLFFPIRPLAPEVYAA